MSIYFPVISVYDALIRKIEGMPDQVESLTLSMDFRHGSQPFIDMVRLETNPDGSLKVNDRDVVRVNERYFLWVEGEKVQARKA